MGKDILLSSFKYLLTIQPCYLLLCLTHAHVGYQDSDIFPFKRHMNKPVLAYAPKDFHLSLRCEVALLFFSE